MLRCRGTHRGAATPRRHRLNPTPPHPHTPRPVPPNARAGHGGRRWRRRHGGGALWRRSRRGARGGGAAQPAGVPLSARAAIVLRCAPIRGPAETWPVLSRARALPLILHARRAAGEGVGKGRGGGVLLPCWSRPHSRGWLRFARRQRRPPRCFTLHASLARRTSARAHQARHTACALPAALRGGGAGPVSSAPLAPTCAPPLNTSSRHLSYSTGAR